MVGQGNGNKASLRSHGTGLLVPRAQRPSFCSVSFQHLAEWGPGPSLGYLDAAAVQITIVVLLRVWFDLANGNWRTGLVVLALWELLEA